MCDDEIDDVDIDLSDCLIVVDADHDVVSVVVLSVDDDVILDDDCDDDADVPVAVRDDGLDDEQSVLGDDNHSVYDVVGDVLDVVVKVVDHDDGVDEDVDDEL